MALSNNHSGVQYEAGCDEAGRGCLAGPVFAAAVILPLNFEHDVLNDSKQLKEKTRYELREYIESNALAYAVTKLDAPDIDKYNILWASIRCMHKSLSKLSIKPEHIIIDGNRWMPYKKVPFDTIVKGDGLYYSIAAASILAKTYRDDYMKKLHKKFPYYHWDKNKGYPTEEHRNAIMEYGITDYHRRSFQLLPLPEQLKLPLKYEE
jgi:ribonuclease HII